MSNIDLLSRAMNLLCIRNNIEVPNDGHSWIRFDNLGNYFCLLCGENIGNVYIHNSVIPGLGETKRRHAINHVKEHKLLAFL